MKIGLCLTSSPGYSETFIRSKIKGLLAAGLDVHVFLFNRSQGKDDISYHNPFPLRFPFVVILFPLVLIYLGITRPSRVVRFARLEREDGKSIISILKSLYINAHILLHGNLDWLHFAFSTLAIGRENLALAMNAKLAVSFRGFDIGLYPLTHRGCYEKLWTRVKKIHSISEDLYQLGLQQGLSPEIPYQKIWPAIDTSRLLVKNDPGELSDSLVILSVGRLEWKKGFIYSIQAMHELKRLGVKFIYKIVGSGQVEQELLLAIRDFGLEEHVVLLGKMPHDEVFKLMNQADIYIQPSVQEGFCNSLLEAQGTGLLCVATDAEGLRENIIDGKTGWIVGKRDSISIAKTVVYILQLKEEERKKIALDSIIRIKTEFGIERLVKEFITFYS